MIPYAIASQFWRRFRRWTDEVRLDEKQSNENMQ